MKHTPGPWIVAGLNVGSVNNKVVASCYKDSLESVVVRPSDDAECLANARLIAAAPDMLVAIKGAIAALTQNKTYPADILAAVTFLRSAVSKVDCD